jgi:hypothetical protein
LVRGKTTSCVVRVVEDASNERGRAGRRRRPGEARASHPSDPGLKWAAGGDSFALDDDD